MLNSYQNTFLLFKVRGIISTKTFKRGYWISQKDAKFKKTYIRWNPASKTRWQVLERIRRTESQAEEVIRYNPHIYRYPSTLKPSYWTKEHCPYKGRRYTAEWIVAVIHTAITIGFNTLVFLKLCFISGLQGIAGGCQWKGVAGSFIYCLYNLIPRIRIYLGTNDEKKIINTQVLLLKFRHFYNFCKPNI